MSAVDKKAAWVEASVIYAVVRQVGTIVERGGGDRLAWDLVNGDEWSRLRAAAEGILRALGEKDSKEGS